MLARLEREDLLGSIGGAEAVTRLRTLRLKAAVLDLECERLLALLARAGVEVMLLKGAALRRTVYRESAERPMGDLDLLVAPGGMDAALEVLSAAGYELPPERLTRAYQEHHFHAVLKHPGGFLVELHWALSRRESPFQLDAVRFRQRAVDCPLSRGSVSRIPCPEDLLLHMASQNLEDDFSRLRRFVDLDRLIARYPALDWDQVVGQARSGGLVHVLSYSLGLTHRLLDTPIPPAVRGRIQPPLPTRVHLALLGRERAMRRVGEPQRAPAIQLLCLWLIDGTRARLTALRAILRGATDPMEWIWLGHPEPPERGSSWLAGPLTLLKLAAYQVWRYLAGPLERLRSAT